MKDVKGCKVEKVYIIPKINMADNIEKEDKNRFISVLHTDIYVKGPSW